MSSEFLEKFKSELAAVQDSKNLSKQKIQEITKAAIKARGEYKHVVFQIERLITKSKPNKRLAVLYIIDSIIRASQNQFKQKDNFGPRFMKCFDKILDRLLECGLNERLKVVRTLNIWMANKVFPEEAVRPLRERCKRAGLIIDFEEVEMAVKGSLANMNIYNGKYLKKQRRSAASTTPTVPPPEDGLLGAGPSSLLAPVMNIPSFALSEEYHNGTISEREMLELARQFGLDRTGILSKDRALLQKTLQVFSEKLNLRMNEIQAEQKGKSGTSIQNVLTKDFEYSDDEEDKEKDTELEKPNSLTHDEIFELAQKLLSAPTILAQLAEVFEPSSNSSHAPNIAQEETGPATINTLPIGQAPNLLTLQSMSALNPQQLGFPNLPGLNASQFINIQNAQNILLQQRAVQLQALQSLPGAQHNLLMMGNPLINAFGVPTGVNPLMAAADLQTSAQQTQQSIFPDLSVGEIKTDPNSETASKSRSKESRERRKMGLPNLKPGHAIIASRTLWLKKVPSNVTENELKQSVESCGEASRVKIIGNRACAFITMETRKSANEVVQKMREISVSKKMVKVYWARGPGMDSEAFSDIWDSDRGVWEIPYEKLPDELLPLCEGAVLDLESLPADKKSSYKETGEKIVPASTAPAPIQPPAPAPPLSFPFTVPLASFTGHPSFATLGNSAPKPPGVPQLLNLSVPPPSGLSGFPPVPPPPGVPATVTSLPQGQPPAGMGRPPGLPPQGIRHPTGLPPPGFDPNKPPPMFQQAFNANAPPPPFVQGRGVVPMPPFRRGGAPPPMPFRGGRGNGTPFDSRRGGIPFRPDGQRERAPLLDQREMWNRERERDRSQGERRRYEGDNESGNNRRRASRWGDDDRRDDDSSARRRSPERRPRRSPSRSEEQWEQPMAKKTSADDETVSSTTIDELKPDLDNRTVEVPQKGEPIHEDKTDEVPMDLE